MDRIIFPNRLRWAKKKITHPPSFLRPIYNITQLNGAANLLMAQQRWWLSDLQRNEDFMIMSKRNYLRDSHICLDKTFQILLGCYLVKLKYYKIRQHHLICQNNLVLNLFGLWPLKVKECLLVTSCPKLHMPVSCDQIHLRVIFPFNLPELPVEFLITINDMD